ncbi:CAZyme family GH12 [Paecilomyces variotii]|uniref:xyloglucan-specific endo-beta-1,4-glucanase n=1 Tax=Byssochlamys spectabilis TaxID=264951 RepID=A0A443HMH4_BYSSP|nr:concanavalin A-like lectin/glucanase domain-containing protein [Paecilomyces variotii]KAJ9209410.1 CAZyme family GH12 [Paecilomyces variotii]KAJ9219362.1 CAZyme family GH12 [Paecilomyces variotii]KAJ9229196.1 CAZyme family GH12 [Paecilomyces variotii]KAJ9237113.1 CAZyme family GH12 [Paecilomyces variotii]KAJ9261126.1 CAZyme family GH12 [Paecilomyces variotii]
MAAAFRWLVNAGLLAIPIGTSIGVLVGLDAHRAATGQPPLFGYDPGNAGIPGIGAGGGSSGGSDSTGGGGGGFTGVPSNNGVTTTTYCQKSYGIEPPSKGEEFILNPNQWGVTAGETGALCMNVTTFNNETYPTKYTAPEFSVTWQYPVGPETQPVHAFPNAEIGGKTLPVLMSDVQHLMLDLEWTYGVGDSAAATTDIAQLTDQSVNTNVAIDMFFDSDKAISGNSTEAKCEVMIWFATVGDAAQPIGLNKGIVSSKTLNGTVFNLYVGENGQKQNVLTWATQTTTESFHGDILPLLTDLISANKANYPTTQDYLGHLSLGSEAFSSSSNVTFHVPTFAIQVETTSS